MPPKHKIYFGIFTCKGGVGKTTVAAHLSGAFALQGFNVALIDLDPEQNLQKLIGDGISVDRNQKSIAAIEVYDVKHWDEGSARDSQIIVCDCSPALERNHDFFDKFDFCIIPTTLNPMGLNKHGKVIEDTVNAIRKKNTNAHIFVLINAYKKHLDEGGRGKFLKKFYRDIFESISKTDPKFTCIDPDEVKIRESDQLYYWGTHLLEDPSSQKSELAFKLVGGKCYPRDDFIELAAYIEEKAGLGILRKAETS